MVVLGGSWHFEAQIEPYLEPNHNKIRILKGLLSGLYLH